MKTWRRRLREILIPPGIQLLVSTFTLLSWSASQKLGSYAGWLTFHLCRRQRRRALDHLGIAFPGLQRDQRATLAKASFRHLGTAAGELLHLYGRPTADMSKRLHIEGADAVRELRAAGRQVLIVSGHCGNWELIAEACRSLELPLVAVVRGLNSPALQKLAVAVRGRFGCQAVERGSHSSTGLLLKTLRGAGVLALLIDQDTHTEGVFVPFFGRPAHTPVGAAKLAHRLGAVVVPTFMERLEDGTHRIRFETPMELPEDPREATAEMTARIEAQIRRRPEQWIWMHRRWRRRPAQENEASALGTLQLKLRSTAST